MNILFVVPYPEGEAPSQRFRFEQYFGILKEEGHQYTVASFLDLETWRSFYKSGSGLKKFWGIAKGFFRRLLLLPKLSQYDWVFLHREATPLGPPIFEWLITKVYKKKVIYDFDDAIWLPQDTSREGSITARLRWHHKTATICRWSYRISCGNEYLASWARQHNEKVVINPTTVDTQNLHNQLKHHQEGSVTIGWTGTHSTLRYLKSQENALYSLAKKFPELRFLVISNQPPDLQIPNLEFRPWRKETEAEDLLRMDIGIMPLTADRWTEGKCGFKALQYMALGIPAVISPVGVNTEIVEHGVNGFLADERWEWIDYLTKLVEDVSLRMEMGRRAHEKIEREFSVLSNKPKFLSLFKNAAAPDGP